MAKDKKTRPFQRWADHKPGPNALPEALVKQLNKSVAPVGPIDTAAPVTPSTSQVLQPTEDAVLVPDGVVFQVVATANGFKLLTYTVSNGLVVHFDATPPDFLRHTLGRLEQMLVQEFC